MKDKISRRNFLKHSAGIGLGASFLGKFPYIITGRKKTYFQGPIIINSHGRRGGAEANKVGWEILSSGGSALDAVEKATNVVETNPEDTSVGYGGLPNYEGVVELDASVVDGKSYNMGAVGALRNIKTPCSVARLVMERTDHIFLVGEGALRFAKMHGFKEYNLLTEKARKIWLRWKEHLNDNDDYFPPADDDYGLKRPTGTINVLAIDKNGDIAGITSTSGLAFKVPGRVGDSPIIGAGLYVDNNVGAAGATGRGEEVIKVCGSFLVVENMRNGMSPQKACEDVCHRIINNYGGPQNVKFNDKFIAINKNGEIGCAAIRGRKERPPTVAVRDANGERTYKGKYIIEV
ncbi:asparaginase [candidate division KSB1 bacterium]|nr:MAG: asparaginase [candidate division KSB1 bacterium]